MGFESIQVFVLSDLEWENECQGFAAPSFPWFGRGYREGANHQGWEYSEQRSSRIILRCRPFWREGGGAGVLLLCSCILSFIIHSTLHYGRFQHTEKQRGYYSKPSLANFNISQLSANLVS